MVELTKQEIKLLNTINEIFNKGKAKPKNRLKVLSELIRQNKLELKQYE